MPEKRGEREAGEIRLRQTVQVTIAGQARTLEIAVTLPPSATEEEIDRAMHVAQLGMQGIGERIDQSIGALQNGTYIDAPMEPHALTESASPSTPPLAQTTDAPEPTPTAAVPEPPPAEAAPAVPSGRLSMAAFLRAATELGFNTSDLPSVLGVASLTEIDREVALAKLHTLASAKAATPEPATPAPTAPRRFAEEDTGDDGIPDDMPGFDGINDEPDFAFPEDEEDGVFASEPEKLNEQVLRARETALKQLRELRIIRGGGPLPAPEQRPVFMNCVVEQLGGVEHVQELINAVWNPPPTEKLNAARTRALIEWSKSDDQFGETAALMITLAHQPAPVEG